MPSIVYVQPPEHGYVLSQGLVALPTLRDRLLVASDAKKLLPPDLATQTKPYDRGLMTFEQMSNLPNDPAAVVELLKKRIKGEE